MFNRLLQFNFLVILTGSSMLLFAEPPIITAVFNKDTDRIKDLLAQGADPLEPKEDGATAVDVAICGQDAKIINMVLNTQNPVSGETPLIKAVYLQNNDLVNKLIDNGANPWLAKKDGFNGLDFALWGQNKDIKYKVLNYRNNSHGGETPLIKAIFERNYDRAQELLHNGANPYLAKHDGANAFDFAGYTKEQRFMNLLEPYRDLTSSYCGTWDLFRRINLTAKLLEYAGDGSDIALFDNGVNFKNPHLGMDKSISGGGRFFPVIPSWGVKFATEQIDNKNSEYLYNEDGHGTHMAMILQGNKNRENFQGIASSTKILPMPKNFYTSPFHILDYLAKNKNIKIGAASLHFQFDSLYYKDRDANRNPNALFVTIIGNNKALGKTEISELEIGLILDEKEELANLPIYRKLLVGVAVDWNNKLTPNSRQCNKLAPICVAVPTVGPTSPTVPILAGSLAILMKAVPGLDEEIYAQAVKATVTKLHSPKEETGLGLLNVQGAYEYLRDKKYNN